VVDLVLCIGSHVGHIGSVLTLLNEDVLHCAATSIVMAASAQPRMIPFGVAKNLFGINPFTSF
jgi:hypothetical protein